MTWQIDALGKPGTFEKICEVVLIIHEGYQEVTPCIRTNNSSNRICYIPVAYPAITISKNQVTAAIFSGQSPVLVNIRRAGNIA